MMTRRRFMVGIAAAGTLGLAACSGLPQSGPVVEGRRLGDVGNEPVFVGAQGPVPGSSEIAVARGFIRAGEDSDETRAAGRAFLAPQSADLWRWSSLDIVVYDSAADLTARKVDARTVEVTTRAVATVSPDGRYQELAVKRPVKVRFGVTRVGGEWRLDLPAAGFGLWLESNAFDRLYASRLVTYVTPAGRRLVSDPRWFPNSRSLATTLARAQLEAVPPHLAGAVVTAVPRGTRLAVNAVPVENGQAKVSLSDEVLEAGPDDRRAVWAQLVATLTQVPAVTAVAISSDATSLDLPGSGSSFTSASELGYEIVLPVSVNTALLRTGDVLTRIDPRLVGDVPGSGRQSDTKPQDGDIAEVPDQWTRLALSANGREIGAVSGDLRQLSRWRAGAEAVVVPDFATSLSRPTYDSAGYLWVAGAEPSGRDRIFVLSSASTDPAAVPTALDVPWLTGRRVVSLTLAPDGARALIVTTDADGGDHQLGLSGVVRQPNGEPATLAPPLRQAQPLTLIRDVVWLDSNTYAVLGRIASTEPVRPWLGTLGSGLDGVRRRGSADPANSRLAPVPQAVAITTVGGPRGIVVVTDDQRVLVRTGSTWLPVGRGTDLLVPGR